MVGEYDDKPNWDDDDIHRVMKLDAGEDNSVTTEDIPDYIPYLDKPLGADDKSTLLMMLPGQTTPITFEDTPSIILGRYDQTTGIYPTVDLTPYFGKTHGVSRRHAEIFLHEGRYYLRDLDSANGTWLNNKKVTHQPQLVKSGDQVRLGELLIVLFLSDKAIPSHIKQTSQSGQQTLYVQYVNTEQQLAPDSMSIEFISQTLLVYLSHLDHIQATVQDLNQQPTNPITISSIQVVNKPNTLELQLYIQPKLLVFLRDSVQKWVNKGEYNNKDVTLSSALYRRYAKEILAQLTPILPDHAQYDAHIDRLQTDLQMLFTMNLKMISPLEG